MNRDSLIRILCVDDHPLFREGIAASVNIEPDMQVVGQVTSASEVMEQFETYQPDVTLMDVRISGTDGIDMLTAIRSRFPHARIVMLTTLEGDVAIRRALEAGARGYLLKTTRPRDLVKVIRQVHAGKKHVPPEVAARLAEYLSDDDLTQREVEVVKHLGGGNRNRDIAERLFVTEETVKVHLKHLMDKLGANDRTHAFAIALQRGIVQL